MAEPIGSKFCVPRINTCYLYYVCLSLCLFVSNQSVPNLVWKGLWMIKISKVSLLWNSIIIKFWNPINIFIKSTNFFFTLVYNVNIQRENVCIQQTSKLLKRSGPNFVWDLTWPQGRYMEAQSSKKVPKVFFFFKCETKYYETLELFFCVLLFYIVHRKDAYR